MALAPPAGQCSLPRHKHRLGMVEEHDKELKVSTWPPNSSDPDQIEHLWDVHEQI